MKKLAIIIAFVATILSVASCGSNSTKETTTKDTVKIALDTAKKVDTTKMVGTTKVKPILK